MLPEDLHRTVQRQRLDRMAPAGGRRGPKQGIVDCLFSGFDRGQEQRRHGVVDECFEISGDVSLALVYSFDTDIGGRRKRDGVISATVTAGGTGFCEAHDRARRQTAQVSRVERGVSRNHDDN